MIRPSRLSIKKSLSHPSLPGPEQEGQFQKAFKQLHVRETAAKKIILDKFKDKSDRLRSKVTPSALSRDSGDTTLCRMTGVTLHRKGKLPCPPQGERVLY